MLHNKSPFVQCPCRGGKPEGDGEDEDEGAQSTTVSTSSHLPHPVRVEGQEGKEDDNDHDDGCAFFWGRVGLTRLSFDSLPLGNNGRYTFCPLLNIRHPPSGEEFALGCSVCRRNKGDQASSSSSSSSPSSSPSED